MKNIREFRSLFAAKHKRRVAQSLRRVMRAEILERREVFDGTFHSLADGNFSQNWSETSQIFFDDDWVFVPSIIGYRGDNLTTSTGVDPQTVLNGDDEIPVTDVIANQADPNTLTSGGVAEFAIANPVVALQGSGTADAPYLLLHMNSLGRSGIQVQYALRDIDGSGDNAIQQVALQYRVGTTGPFTNVPAAYVADASTGPNLADSVINVSATLPAFANNVPQLQLRVMTTNAVGNDEWIGIDDILVSSVPFAPTPDFNISIDAGSAVKAEGNAGTTSFSYTVTRSGDTTVAATVDWVVEGLAFNGASPADGADFAGGIGGTLSFGPGVTSLPIVVTVFGDSSIETDEGFRVTLQNATPGNATISTPQANSIIVNDDLQQVLQPGDVVITAIGTAPNPDRFSFVPLVDLVEGLELKFTDNGWDGAGSQSLQSVEGTVVFTVPSGGLAKNTKVIVNLSQDQSSASVLPSSAGTAQVVGSFALNSLGDSLIAYTGSPRLASTTTPLFSVNTNVSYVTGGTISNSTTYLPTGLSIGSTAVEALGTLLDPDASVQEGQYDHSTISGDASSLRLAVADVSRWIVDNNDVATDLNSTDFSDGSTAGVLVSESGGSTSIAEGGMTDSYTLVLAKAPVSDVTIAILPNAQVTVSTPSIVFNASNWNVPQEVIVTAVDDTNAEGLHTGLITHSVTSSDAAYNGITVADIQPTIADNDTPVAQLRLNEIYVNPPGTDDAREYIEFRVLGDSAQSLAGLTLLIFEGDGSAAGTIDVAMDLSALSTGTNGLLLLGTGYPATNPWTGETNANTAVANLETGTLENGSTTFMIVSGFTGAFGTDLDADDDGILDTQPWNSILDSVGWRDDGATDLIYSPAVLTQLSGTPDAASRFPADMTANSLDAWFNSDMLAGGTDLEYDGSRARPNFPIGAVLTPGAANFGSVATAGISVTPTSGLSTSESGGTASFTVVLDSQPTGDVTIALISSDPSEGTVPATIVFNDVNWNVPQTITIQGVNDFNDDGDQSFNIVLQAASSTDPSYDGLDPADVAVVNVDDDMAGIVVSPTSGLATSESGGSANFTIVLTSQPLFDVTVPLVSNNVAEGTVSVSSVTFDSTNWNVPQSITVTGVDDSIDDGDIAYSILVQAATSTDANYGGFDATDVSLVNVDDDAAGEAPKVGTVVFGDGTAQRSMVQGMVVTFDSIVEIQPGAFQLERLEGGTSVVVDATVSIVNGVTEAKLSFSGAGIIGGSLPDGNYVFRIDSTKVNSNGQELDGDGDGSAGGDYVRGTESTDQFFRLFGDIDGSRLVTVSDFNQFRAVFGRTSSEFDFDGSGSVGVSDFNEFRSRFGRSL